MQFFWGILVPFLVLSFSFLVTFLLYRHFAKELHSPPEHRVVENQQSSPAEE